MKRNLGKLYSGEVKFYPVKSCICCDETIFEELYITKDIRINKDIRTVICKSCGFIFQNPMPSEISYINFYKQQRDGAFKTRDQIIEPKKYLHKLFVEILINNIPNLNQMYAVDFASGNGSFLHYLKPHVKNLKAVELSEKSIKTIPELFSVDVVPTSKFNSTFKKNTLNLITGLAIIEHFHNPIKALNEFHSALNDEGYLFLYTHDVKKPFFDNNKKSYFKFIHPYYFSTNTLSNALRKTGFDNIRYLSFDIEENRKKFGNISAIPGFIVVIAQKNKNVLTRSLLKDNPRLMRFIFGITSFKYYIFLVRLYSSKVFWKIKSFFIKTDINEKNYEKAYKKFIQGNKKMKFLN